VKSPARAILTTERRLGPGPVARTGTRAAYRSVAEGEGEPHVVRTELIGERRGEAVVPQGEAIACFAHLTDLHVTDTQSPARFEFVNREAQDERFRELLPMHRPQETLNPHAIAAIVRAINNVAAGPLTGGRVQLAVLTGDAIDNTQRNELTNFLALLNGGTVRPDSGAPGYEGVQLPHWPGDIYWKPDGLADGDQFQHALGFPSSPGILDEAVQRFETPGLGIPWLGCYGNHEEVCQGVGVVTPELADAMTGSAKPVELPPGLDRHHVIDSFVSHPEQFMAGPSIQVPPDPERRPISRIEFIDAHFRSGRHGFTVENCDEGAAYYAHDSGRVRFITLDTVCDEGGADGSVDSDQLHWLERRLEEVHSSFRSRDGSMVRTRNADRYVVVMSHHGYDTLSNPRGARRPEALLDLLLRFRNVVLWLNGHIHMNRITPRPRAGAEGGLWEVTTSSLVDWPCQARLVELVAAGDGLFAIGTTMLDHDGEGLAGLHRELAANVPFNGFDSRRAGAPLDRNAILLLPAPF
jgi:metallophosphoesterase (TIGR03767 family)